MKDLTLHPIEHVKLELIHEKVRIIALVAKVRETLKKAVPVAVALAAGSLFMCAMIKYGDALMANTCYRAVCTTVSGIFHCGL